MMFKRFNKCVKFKEMKPIIICHILVSIYIQYFIISIILIITSVVFG